VIQARLWPQPPEQSRPINPQDRTHRTALTDQTHSRRASPQEPPALCQPLGKAESSTLDFKTMTSNAEKQSNSPAAATVQPPKLTKRSDVAARRQEDTKRGATLFRPRLNPAGANLIATD